MPPLFLPEGVPLGLGWYLLWISIHGMLIYLFHLLAAPHANSKQKAEEATEKRLVSINSYLWDISMNLGSDPYDGPLASADDLSNLLRRARDANKPMAQYNRLQKQTAFGKLACIIGIVVALIFGGLYLLKYPSTGIANLLGIIGFGIFIVWSLWHIIHAGIYYRLTLRPLDEEE